MEKKNDRREHFFLRVLYKNFHKKILYKSFFLRFRRIRKPQKYMWMRTEGVRGCLFERFNNNPVDAAGDYPHEKCGLALITRKSF